MALQATGSVLVPAQGPPALVVIEAARAQESLLARPFRLHGFGELDERKGARVRRQRTQDTRIGLGQGGAQSMEPLAHGLSHRLYLLAYGPVPQGSQELLYRQLWKGQACRMGQGK